MLQRSVRETLQYFIDLPCWSFITGKKYQKEERQVNEGAYYFLDFFARQIFICCLNFSFEKLGQPLFTREKMYFS
jgi:hypothetical protein